MLLLTIPLNVLKMKSFNHVWIHFNRGNLTVDEDDDEIFQDGYYEMQINDYYVKNDIDIEEYYCSDENFHFRARGATAISNIIVSDEVIERTEKLIELPVDSTDTDMILTADGAYSATIEDQYILQSINTSNLFNDYGRKPEVKEILLIGNPTYAMTTGLSSVTNIMRCDEEVIEYDSTTVGSSSNDYVMFTMQMTSMQLKDLKGKEYGFKVGV